VTFFDVLVVGVVDVTASLGVDLASMLVAEDCFTDGDVTFDLVQDAGRGGGGGTAEFIPAAAWKPDNYSIQYNIDQR